MLYKREVTAISLEIINKAHKIVHYKTVFFAEMQVLIYKNIPFRGIRQVVTNIKDNKCREKYEKVGVI